MNFIAARKSGNAAATLALDLNCRPALADGSFAQAALGHLARFHETESAAERFTTDRHVIGLLANSALPSAEYILVVSGERSTLVLAGAPEASDQVAGALEVQTVEDMIFHVRIQPNKVSVTGINDVRAACIACIDWGMGLDSVRHEAARTKPLHIVRRQGHVVATGVIVDQIGDGPDEHRRLVGQLSIPNSLSTLERIRAWHLITLAAVDEVGRLVVSSDDVTVNHVPAGAWLTELTCCTDARVAQWLAHTAN